MLSCLASARRRRRASFCVSSRAAATACGSTARSGCAASKRLHRQSSGERPRRPARERLAVLHRAMSVAMRPLRRLASSLMVLHTRRAASERPRRRNFTASLPASDDSAVPQPYFDAVVCLLLAANWPSPLKPLATRRLRPFPNTAPGRRLPPQRSTTRALGAPLEQFQIFVRVDCRCVESST